jgi:pSer/pThr/pTyr-binding forkhead associated (FHA) protein
MRTWMIGSASDCDIVVVKPTVSGHHCRLTELPEGYLLEDLGSSNGTFVNGQRMAAALRVLPSDAITLGVAIPMPWPQPAVSPGAKIVRIGRDADNDIVLDDPRVSGHHARLLMSAGAVAFIEDIGSSNGTCVNSVDQRAKQAIALRETDTVYFGTFAVPAGRLLARAHELEQVRAPSTFEPPRPAANESPPRSERLRLRPIASRTGPWRVAALGQVPVLALFIVLLFGRQAGALITTESRQAVRQGVASTTFALALAAVWLGCSLAVGEIAGGRLLARQASPDQPKSLVSAVARLGVLVSLCALGCAVLLAIVYLGNGLKGRWLEMWAVLVLAAAVGLFLGLAVRAHARNWATTAVVLLVCFVPMVVLGGAPWPLPDLAPPARLVANAMPSRWAFEGLLLIETSAREPVADAGDEDLAARYFPVDSERMGPKADTMALGLMVIGLAATMLIAFWNHPLWSFRALHLTRS